MEGDLEQELLHREATLVAAPELLMLLGERARLLQPRHKLFADGFPLLSSDRWEVCVLLPSRSIRFAGDAVEPALLPE